jgi:hypothetical protein
MPEGMLGRRVRCFGCDERFLATPDSEAPPRPDLPVRPRPVPVPATPGPTIPLAADDEPGRGGPYCPGCGQGVPWRVHYCPHCGEEFDDGERDRDRTSMRHRLRRDALPHRGALLTTLANVSLVAGFFSLCFGVGAMVGVPLAIAVWVMAQTDLAQMRAGLMDSHGRQLTETARASAITGLILSLLFAAGYGALLLTTL